MVVIVLRVSIWMLMEFVKNLSFLQYNVQMDYTLTQRKDVFHVLLPANYVNQPLYALLAVKLDMK